MPPSVSSQGAGFALVSTARPTRLLHGIYRDIGMAAVANELNVEVEGLTLETVQSVSRGVRYIHLMPKRQENGLPSPIRR